MPKVDYIIFGVNYFGQKKPFDPNCLDHGNIIGLKECIIPTIALISKEGQYTEQKYNWIKENNFNLVLTQHWNTSLIQEKCNTAVKRIQTCAFDPTIFYPQNLEHIYDVGFTGSLHFGGKITEQHNFLGNDPNFMDRIETDLRPKMVDIIKKMNIKLFLKEHKVENNKPNFPYIKDIQEYAKTITQTKIWLTTIGPASHMSTRFFEVIGSKTLLLCNEIDPIVTEGILENGKHCVMFKNDLSDFEEKINYYLNHEDERLKIVEEGYRFFLEYHTWEKRAEELENYLKDIY